MTVLRKYCAIICTFVVAMLPGYSAYAGTDTYIYDALGRVVSVVHANGTSTSYTYDAAGNRKTVVTVTSAAVTWGNFNWNNATWHN